MWHGRSVSPCLPRCSGQSSINACVQPRHWEGSWRHHTLLSLEKPGLGQEDEWAWKCSCCLFFSRRAQLSCGGRGLCQWQRTAGTMCCCLVQIQIYVHWDCGRIRNAVSGVVVFMQPKCIQRQCHVSTKTSLGKPKDIQGWWRHVMWDGHLHPEMTIALTYLLLRKQDLQIPDNVCVCPCAEQAWFRQGWCPQTAALTGRINPFTASKYLPFCCYKMQADRNNRVQNYTEQWVVGKYCIVWSYWKWKKNHFIHTSHQLDPWKKAPESSFSVIVLNKDSFSRQGLKDGIMSICICVLFSSGCNISQLGVHLLINDEWAIRSDVLRRPWGWWEPQRS